RTKAFLHVLNDSADLIKVPDVLIGFKLPDAKKAENQLKRLEKVAGDLAERVPALKGRVKHTKGGDGSCPTLAREGSMGPWDKVPWNQIEDNEGEYDKLKKRLPELKLTLTVGVRENCLLLAVGHSTGPLGQLGQGDKLGNRPEFKTVARYAAKK